MSSRFFKSGHRPDYFLLALVFVLTVFGLVMLSSASSDLGRTRFDDSYYYVRHQIYYGLLFGIVGFLAAYFINYRRIKKFALPLLLISIVFLALVFTSFGLEVRSANRWLRFGPISFQPAELMKLTFIIYLAAWFSNQKMKRVSNIGEGLLPFGIMTGFIAILLLLQPATSTVVILLTAGFSIYFLSGAKWRHIGAMVFLAVLGIGLVILATPYRLKRITGFLNPGEDALGQNYQLNQAQIAIGSGGLSGAGYGQSATKVSYLPTPIDDSIFAVVGEELGFMGAGGLIALFAVFTFRIFWLAKNTHDQFGKFLLIGFGTVIALQSFVNMASISGLIPLTGVPLPFVSYGGTALAIFLTMSGIIINVSKYT
jgi:cell division protein FtsW